MGGGSIGGGGGGAGARGGGPASRGGGRGGVEGGRPQFPPPPKFLNLDNTAPNSHFRGKYIRNNLIIIMRVLIICKLSGNP
jgi:hypothetical protein